MRDRFGVLRRLLELCILVILLFLSNRRSWYCFFVLDDREYFCEYGNSSSDFFWWGVVGIGVLLLVLQNNLMNEYIFRWKANWPLLLFVVYSLLSLTWTTNISRSIHTVYILIAASISAAGIATMYSRSQIFRLLLWFVGSVAALSLIAVILLPNTAITQVFYLAGTWRGVFWHKNYLGSVMAFGNGLFLLSLWWQDASQKARVVSTLFYFLTLFLAIMSRSATGLITLLLLNGLILLYYAWVRWGRLLKRTHYVSLAALFTLLVALVLPNLTWLFSLIGKQPTLTGRVPLWQYLLRDVVSQRPWLGYGWETVWHTRTFQVASAKNAGWGVVVVNSHSGYMDILVYLGVLGLAIFLLVMIFALVRAFRDVLSRNFVSLLILAYVLTANVTISYFLEFESFHWLLLVFVLFMTLSRSNVQSTQMAS